MGARPARVGIPATSRRPIALPEAVRSPGEEVRRLHQRRKAHVRVLGMHVAQRMMQPQDVRRRRRRRHGEHAQRRHRRRVRGRPQRGKPWRRHARRPGFAGPGGAGEAGAPVDRVARRRRAGGGCKRAQLLGGANITAALARRWRKAGRGRELRMRLQRLGRWLISLRAGATGTRVVALLASLTCDIAQRGGP